MISIHESIQQFQSQILLQAPLLLMKILGAFALWAGAGVLIRGLRKLLVRGLERRKVDATLTVYAGHTLGFGLRLFTIFIILGIFGIETTSFSAVIAAAGVAIGVAWSGLLSNFAAGIFLILFRPFKLGDTIMAAGVTGVVREIGLFATLIDSGENLCHFVGNNKLFSDNILNYSKNPTRIAQFKVQLPHGVDTEHAISRFVSAISSIEGMGKDQPVTGEILEFNPAGPVIQIRAACRTAVHGSVVAEGNRKIAGVFRAEGYLFPSPYRREP